MKHTMPSLKTVCFIAGFMISFVTYAIDSRSIENQTNLFIEKLYHRLQSIPNTSIEERITWISAQFLGKEYMLGSLGEGPDARFDQFPRYQVDAFDCETYVTTVLSLVLANSLPSFQNCLRCIRYKDGKISYIHRNHFTSLDWNQNNQQRGILKDITLDIKDKQNKPVAQLSKTLIDKSNWYAKKTISSIRLQTDNKQEQEQEQEQRLNELKIKGQGFEPKLTEIPYIPLNRLLENNGVNQYLLAQIPEGAIIEIIRPNWDLREQIGTYLDVSHLGFAIWKEGQLYFREASTIEKKVIDIPLMDYLEEAQKSPTIKGINIQVVLPKTLGKCSP